MYRSEEDTYNKEKHIVQTKITHIPQIFQCLVADSWHFECIKQSIYSMCCNGRTSYSSVQWATIVRTLTGLVNKHLWCLVENYWTQISSSGLCLIELWMNHDIVVLVCLSTAAGWTIRYLLRGMNSQILTKWMDCQICSPI